MFLRSVLIVVGVVAVVIAVATLLSGGGTVRIGGVAIAFHGVLRPLVVAVVAFGFVATIDGPRVVAARCLALTRRASTFHAATLVLALTVFGVGVVFGSTAAGGADAYGYVSQADLWLDGQLTTRQPWVASAPWPNAELTFAPLGYRPRPDGDVGDIVPTYSPGVPLIMAAFKRVAGHAAMFLVVPGFGALLVLATYGIGVRLISAPAGFLAALLVVCSPPVLMMLLVPLIDVPVASAWALATFLALRPGAVSASYAGLAVSLAIVIRPNLAFLAPVIGLLCVAPQQRLAARQRVLTASAFIASGILGPLFVAYVNSRLYGSATTSGYGPLAGLLDIRRVVPNLEHYLSSLALVHTPLIFLAFAPVLMPVRSFWPGASPGQRIGLSLFVAGTWAFYCGYLQFSEWWYLRFLIVSWPILMLGIVSVAVAARTWRTWAGTVVLVAIAGAWLYGVRTFDYDIVHDTWKEERRYPAIARLTRESTPQNSVVLAMQHSGTVRYYGGRVTMRFDLLDDAWLDRAVEWFGSRGVEVFLLADEWELESIQARFAGARTLSRIASGPVWVFPGPGATRLYNLSHESIPLLSRPQAVTSSHSFRAVLPEPMVPLDLR